MNKTQEEFTKAVYETIKDKVFFSNFSSRPADVVAKLPEEMVPGKVLFDGMMLLDGIEGIEDDIQQMHSYLRDGTIVNLEDYYTDNGAFEDEGWEKFIGALEQLMTLEEFFKYLEDRGEDPDWLYLTHDSFPANEPLYPIDENGHAEIPEGTTYLDDLAFFKCPGLVSVRIPDSVNWIGAGAFSECTNLTSIKASGVRVIDNEAFEGCSKLSSIEITSPDLHIYTRAFKDCSALMDVVIPKVADISEDAFEGCPCEYEVMKMRFFEFKTVKQMTDKVKMLIACRELGFREERDGRTLVYHTNKFKEKIVFEYRNNKIFYTIYAHGTIYDSWTIHQEKVLENFFKLYESTK